MEKFECLKTSQYIVALAISDMCGMRGELMEEFGEAGCDLFADWMLSWVDGEQEKITKEYARRIIGEKIKELKGE